VDMVFVKLIAIDVKCCIVFCEASSLQSMLLKMVDARMSGHR
jgi:hypothetical protein